jgi:hypothetical protein
LGSVLGASCEVHGGSNDTGTGFLQNFLGFAHGNHQSTIARYLSITIPEVCDGPDKAAQYHILGLQIWGFISVMAPGCLQSKVQSFWEL